MPEISKILVKGTEYDIEDEEARNDIAGIRETLPTFHLDGTTLTITTPSE